MRDTGIGIPVDRLARLFKSFSQVDASTTRQYGGTGLGLAISKRLVELMGGKMWVESVPQKGSTFHFTLPLQAAAGAPAASGTGRQPQLADLRLLIVDDNPTNCRILTFAGQQMGHDPARRPERRRGPGMAAGRRKLRPGHPRHANARHGRPDAGGRNPQAARPRQTMPLVLLTSMGVRSDRPEFASAAFASCLTKPIKPAQLHEVLVRVLSGVQSRRPQSCRVSSKLDPTLASRLPLRVLLCDDNVVNQKVALRLLQQMGYRPDVAANGSKRWRRSTASRTILFSWT